MFTVSIAAKVHWAKVGYAQSRTEGSEGDTRLNTLYYSVTGLSTAYTLAGACAADDTGILGNRRERWARWNPPYAS